jgi:FkbM family methyltransferase
VSKQIIKYQWIALKIPGSSQEFKLVGLAGDRSVLSSVEKAGIWEPHVMNVLADIIQPTDVCLDVGANIGIYTIFLCQLAEHVVAFEPSNITVDCLAKNVSANALENARVVRCAIGSIQETKTFVHLLELPGCSFVNEQDNPEAVQKFWGRDLERVEETVQIETLDGWLSTHGENRVDFVKMDVEGSEVNAIQGGWETFSKQKPKLAIEFNRRALAEKNGVDPRLLYDQLVELYDYVYVLQPGKAKPPTRVISYEELLGHLPDSRFWADLLCLNQPLEDVPRRSVQR